MPKARSYKNQPWTGFQKQSYSILKDDFVHQKVLTVKANIESTKGGVNLKEALSQKGDTLTSTGQTKLWFYFKNNYSLYAKVLPNSLSLTYDHGIQEDNNKFINWYGGVETNRNLNNNNWRVGVDFFSGTGKWMCNNMLQFNQNDRSFLWFHKAYTTHNQWLFNNYTTLDLTAKALRQTAFLISSRNKGLVSNDYSARFELDGFQDVNELKKSLWSGNKVTLNWINSEKGKYAHGVEFSSRLSELCSTNDLMKKFTAAFEMNVPEQNSTFKLRLSGNWSAAVSLKHKLGNYGTYVWGAELSEIGSKNNVRFGVQVDLNL